MCIAATAADDLGDCGSYREVSRGITAASDCAGIFANDLWSHLEGWYAAHGADVAAMGGNTLEGAQGAISTDAVYEVTDPRRTLSRTTFRRCG